MPTAVVTGANRGIGLEFVHQLTKAGWEVYALCRQSSEELEGLQPKKIFIADVRHVQEIQNIFASIDEPLDLLINNAGVSDGRWSTFDEVEWDVALEVLEVNAISPMMVTQAALPLLRQATNPCVAMVTSLMGSIGDCQSGKSYAYRASKAALNMIIKNLSIELKRTHKQSIVVGLHPGTVDSALSKPYQTRVPKHQLFSPSLSAKYLHQVLNELTIRDTGHILDWAGKELAP